jgi:hypothetical protein
MGDFNGGAPFSARSALRLSWRMLRRSPVGFLIVAIISLFVSNGIAFMRERDVISAVWAFAMMVACSAFFSGMIAHAVFRRLMGESAGVIESVHRTVAVIRSLLLLLVFYIVPSIWTLCTVLGDVIGPLANVLDGVTWGIVIPPLVMAGVLLFGCVMVICRTAIAVCVIEQAGPLSSFQRGAALTKGRRFRIFGVYLVIITFEVAALVPVGLVTESFAWSGLTAAICGDFFIMIPETLMYIADAVIYYSLRVEKEGLAPMELAKVFD